MLSNYILIAFRNLLKHKVFSLINITGLSIGIACCTLLALYIQDELSYEKHFEGSERIYRLTTTLIQEDGATNVIQRTSPPIVLTMAEQFAEIEAATRVVNAPEVEQHLVRYKDKTFYEKKGYLVDSTFLDVFSFQLREGDRTTALDEPSTVILSDALATKLFGNESALDETIIINSGWSTDTFRITGVLAPYTKRSHLNADFYMSMNSRGWGATVRSMTTWNGQNFVFSYLKLKPKAASKDLIAKFPQLIDTYGGEELRAAKRKKTLDLQPLQSIHLHSGHFDFKFDLSDTGSMAYVYVMGSVAAFILLIACINFMNLTTAKSTQRAGEVGVRKTMGANRAQLMRQFLGESFIIAIFSMIVSVVVIQLVLPVFNSLTGRSLVLTVQNWWYLSGFLLGTTLITGLIAGSYPAFFLSSFQPAEVLKNKHKAGQSSNFVRKGLVVVQFVIAITLIASSIVINQQLRFIQDKELGYDALNTLMIPLRTQEARDQYVVLKKEIENLSGVELVTGTTSLPSTPLLRDFTLYAEGNGNSISAHHFISNIDEGYFELLNVPLILGRNLKQESDAIDFSKPKARIVINRASMEKLNIPEEKIIGTVLYWVGQNIQNAGPTRLEYEVVGVVEDFHYASLHDEIQPLVFFLPEQKNSFNYMAIKLTPGSYEESHNKIGGVWKQNIAATPYETLLLSQNVANKYENDRQVGNIITVFTTIAILISCLGLYGLSIYVGERRIKEIGIRKVLGASIPSIVRMLSVEFLILVAVSFVIAVPLGYYAMNLWLESFAYKIELNLVFFLFAGAISFLVAWLTIGFESVRAAMANPVNALRND